MPKASESSVKIPVTRIRWSLSNAILLAYLARTISTRTTMTTVGILGGTGPAGGGVAIRLASCGYDVVLGSRDASRAAASAAAMTPRGSGSLSGAPNEEAASCDLVVVATPWDSAVATVAALRSQLANKIVISMVNALAREGRELVPVYPPRGSMAAQLAFALPDSTIVGAFHHLPADQML